MPKKIYISGKITGDENWESKFLVAKAALETEGWTVLSPLLLSDVELEYDEYLAIDFAMIQVCDAVGFLPDWGRSPGAMAERAFAAAHGKELLDLDASQKTVAEIMKAATALTDAVDRQLKVIMRLFEGYKVAAGIAEIAFFGVSTIRNGEQIRPLSILRSGYKGALKPEWHEYAAGFPQENAQEG